METPEEIGNRIAWHETTYKSNGVNEPDVLDCDALAATIAAAIRDAYELAAQVAENQAGGHYMARIAGSAVRALKGNAE